jgi:hypothetical protein
VRGIAASRKLPEPMPTNLDPPRQAEAWRMHLPSPSGIGPRAPDRLELPEGLGQAQRQNPVDIELYQ